MAINTETAGVSVRVAGVTMQNISRLRVNFRGVIQIHENCENFSPRKFLAILQYDVLSYMAFLAAGMTNYTLLCHDSSI